MLTDTTAVQDYFAKLGFEPEIANIYLALYAEGPQTISALARSSKVERTKIYRLIDVLMEANLIEVESHYKRGVIKAAPISNLHILISQKEQELKSLQDTLELIQQVLSRNSLSNPATRVQFYSGIEGLRQMQWNQTSAKSELLAIRHEPLETTLGKTFTTRWADAINQAGLSLRLACTPDFDAKNHAWYKKENVPEVLNNIRTKVIDPATFLIKQNTDIWDDVVAYYNWKDGDIYGVEMYNQDIADMQRTFFETLWQQANHR